MALFVGAHMGSPTSAMASSSTSMELMDCEECRGSGKRQMSEALCGSFCVASELTHKNSFSDMVHHSSDGEPFDLVNVDLLARALSPEPHPPK
ncbi:MAG: hypothetical protein JKX94_02985 [Sneathiella sp.]|nr:hypothetical protein [Sneathiella sp.]